MITYQIVKTNFSTSQDGVQDRVTRVTWNAEKADGTVVARIRSRGTDIPPTYQPADIPYPEVTEENCIAWVQDLEDQAGIEAQLDQILAQLTVPEQGAGLPWVESYPLWAIGVTVDVGYVAKYKEVLYEVVQAHTTESTWAPPATPALWKRYSDPAEGPQPWIQPTGAQDSYQIDDEVTHTGHLWISNVDNNVWEPGAAGITQWDDLGVYP